MDIVFENLDTVNHMVAFIDRNVRLRRAMPEAPRPRPTPQPTPPARAGDGAGQARARGWYCWLGMSCRCSSGPADLARIAIAMVVGGKLTEFRYVGFCTRTVKRERRRRALRAGRPARRSASGHARARLHLRAGRARRGRAGGAARRRVARGDRVATLLEEYDAFFATTFAVWMGGGVVVPLNTSLPAPTSSG